MKSSQEGLSVLISQFWQTETGFCPLFNVYFNAMQINRRVHLSNSIWGTPLCYDLFRKIIDQKKFPFIATNKWIVLAVQWSVNYLFATNPPFEFPVIQKSGGEREKNRSNDEAFWFSSKRNKFNFNLEKQFFYEYTVFFYAKKVALLSWNL